MENEQQAERTKTIGPPVQHGYGAIGFGNRERNGDNNKILFTPTRFRKNLLPNSQIFFRIKNFNNFLDSKNVEAENTHENYIPCSRKKVLTCDNGRACTAK
jgi:hypothetical protein